MFIRDIKNTPTALLLPPRCSALSLPADLDELALHRLQRGLVLHRGSVLQRVLSHLLLPLQPLLDHAAAPAGPPLLPAGPHHTCSSAVAPVS